MHGNKRLVQEQKYLPSSDYRNLPVITYTTCGIATTTAPLTLTDGFHSRPLSVELADSGFAALQEVGRVAAVGGHRAKGRPLTEADVSILRRQKEITADR